VIKIGRPSEREKTTEYASRIINSYLKNKEYTSALLLSSIYANIRLRSLITDWLSPPRNKWKKASEILTLGFRRLVDLCDKLKLLHDNEKKTLYELWDKRCNVAHESKLWKKLSEKEKKKIDHLCKSTIQFLEKKILTIENTCVLD